MTQIQVLELNLPFIIQVLDVSDFHENYSNDLVQTLYVTSGSFAWRIVLSMIFSQL